MSGWSFVDGVTEQQRYPVVALHPGFRCADMTRACASELVLAPRFHASCPAGSDTQLREPDDAHNCDHGSTGDCCDEQCRPQWQGSGEAQVVQLDDVLVLQDQDDEQHQENERHRRGDQAAAARVVARALGEGVAAPWFFGGALASGLTAPEILGVFSASPSRSGGVSEVMAATSDLWRGLAPKCYCSGPHRLGGSPCGTSSKTLT